MNDKDIAYIQFENEEARLHYIIDQFKKYDAKRKQYLTYLENLNDKYRGRINELEKLTERQHEEIDALIESYDDAKGLIQNPAQKAWVYELINKAAECSRHKTKSTNLEQMNYNLCKKNEHLQERNKTLSSRVKALEDIIKNLPNGRKQIF